MNGYSRFSKDIQQRLLVFNGMEIRSIGVRSCRKEQPLSLFHNHYSIVWLVAVFNLAYFGVEFSVALVIGPVISLV